MEPMKVLGPSGAHSLPSHKRISRCAEDFEYSQIFLSKTHRKMVPTVRGDSSAKLIPWDKVKKNPTAAWDAFDHTYWGKPYSTTE